MMVTAPKGYRRNVGLIILNERNKVLMGQGDGYTEWKMPQGGIDGDETPLQAALRELREETGIIEKDVTLIRQAKRWRRHDWPTHIQVRTGTTYKGQNQLWFAFRYHGHSLIDSSEEFERFRWDTLKFARDHCIDWRRPTYDWLLGEFNDLFKPT